MTSLSSSSSSLSSLSSLLIAAEKSPVVSSKTPPPYQQSQPEEVASLLKYKLSLNDFITGAPKTWENGLYIKNFSLFGETINCVLWNNAFFITGTDVVKSIIWKFRLDGHVIQDRKKFEEGVFSDLRNLKPGTHAILEEPRSRFLEFLFKNNCIRTHKKQKVFYWHAVDFDKLYDEALRREQKREIEPIADTLLALSHNGPSNETSLKQKRSAVSMLCSSPPATPSEDEQRKKMRPTSLSFVLNEAEPSTPTSLSPRNRLEDSFTSDSEGSFESDDSGDVHKNPKSKGTIYSCTHPSCNRQFKRYQHLRRHMKTHSGEKPFICPDSNCTKKFSKIDQLSHHIDTCHN